MEALAAISLAGNILQFAGFALRVVSAGNALKRSHDGALKEHAQLDKIAENLQNLLPQTATVSANPILLSLVDQCSEVASALRQALDRVRLRGSKDLWSTCRAALLSVLKKEDLQSLEKRLNDLTNQTILHLLVTLKQDFHQVQHTQARIEEGVQDVSFGVQDLSRRQQAGFTHLHRQAQRLSLSLKSSEALNPKLDYVASQIDKLLVICENFLYKQSATEGGTPVSKFDPPSPKDFLETLRFRRMEEREQTIPNAHVRTFEWLLMDSTIRRDEETSTSFENERRDMRNDIERQLLTVGVKNDDIKALFPKDDVEGTNVMSLQQWLCTGNGLFWIWGKPGCGKSTLMKAMIYNKKLRQQLNRLLHLWSDSQSYIVATFFFYRPGTELQKSHLGLLLSLLYQILTQRADLINVAFSERDQRQAIARYNNLLGTEESPWTLQELVVAFQSLSRAIDQKIFLHIDGIDEMQGLYKDIARILCTICQGPNIKLLAAGRWAPEFKDVFGIARSLNIHDKTAMDILRFTVDKLCTTKMLEIITMPAQIMAVIKEVIDAAEGVFLWVHLVLESLSDGVNQYENFEGLFARLREYPRELDKLYTFLFTSINARYSEETSLWLFLVAWNIRLRRQKEYSYKISRGEPSLRHPIRTSHILAVTSFLNSSHLATSERFGIEFTAKQTRDLEQRIRTRCLHMFELRPKSDKFKRIEVLHRTFHDFLNQDLVFKELKARLSNERDTLIAYLLRFDVEGGRPWSKKRFVDLLHDLRSSQGEFDEEVLQRVVSIILSILQLPVSRRAKGFLGGGRCQLLPVIGEHYWNLQSPLGYTQMLKSDSKPFSWLSMLFTYQNGAKPCYKNTTSSQIALEVSNLSASDKCDLLLAMIFLDLNTHNYNRDCYDRGCSGKCVPAFEAIVSEFYKDGIVPANDLLYKLLIWLRISHRFRHAGRGDSKEFSWSMVHILEVLQAHGADLRTLCPPVFTDPDKSKISAASLISRMIRDFEYGYVQYENQTYGYARQEDENRNALEFRRVQLFLAENGIQRFVVPQAVHREDEIALASEIVLKDDWAITKYDRELLRSLKMTWRISAEDDMRLAQSATPEATASEQRSDTSRNPEDIHSTSIDDTEPRSNDFMTQDLTWDDAEADDTFTNHLATVEADALDQNSMKFMDEFDPDLFADWTDPYPELTL